MTLSATKPGGFRLRTAGVGPLLWVFLLVIAVPRPAAADAAEVAAAAGTAATARPRLGVERAVFRTPAGDVLLAFFPDLAPAAVRQVTTLIEAGAYGGADVSYVNAGFVAQLDPTSEAAAAAPMIKAEFHADLPVRRGMVLMARETDGPDSARASLFIALADLPELAGRYTVIGELVDGSAALSAIEAVPVDATFRPKSPLGVTAATLLTTPAQQFGLALARAAGAPPAAGAGAATAAGDTELRRLLIGSLATLFGLGLAGLGLSHLLGPAAARSCLIVMVLVATPALLAVFLPQAAGHQLAAGGLLGGLLLVIRLLGRFETSRGA